MAVVRDDLGLSKEQVGNTIIASVAITVIARLAIGWLCDKIGPRRAYTWLLAIGSIPVMTIGLADTYETFLLFRLAIGAIGASFVNHAVPHFGDVRAQHRGHGQRNHGGLGQPRRGCPRRWRCP